MTDRTTWKTTTHHWASDVDRDHLERVRRQLGQGHAAGGRRHLMLEVLAYAQDEAASLDRTGSVTVTVGRDGTVTIDDDGRGTDTRTDSDGTVVRKPVMPPRTSASATQHRRRRSRTACRAAACRPSRL